MNNYNFITFEGVEGCGKSTQAKKLQQFFINNNIDVLLTREPGGTILGEKIRNILLDENNIMSSKTELLLNFASRIEHIAQKIKPAINNKQKVICDRFFDSTFAYQGHAMGLDLLQIKQLQEIAIDDFAPDITFLIDVPIEVAFDRIKNRIDNNKYEAMDMNFHHKVRHGFLDLAKNNSRIFVIDGLKDEEFIANQIINIIKN
jgi:dTMP kinase